MCSFRERQLKSDAMDSTQGQDVPALLSDLRVLLTTLITVGEFYVGKSKADSRREVLQMRSVLR